jgi:NADH-quinone oxidoreductase subunit M
MELIIIPIIAGLIAAFTGKWSKWVALLGSLAGLAIVALWLQKFNPDGTFNFVQSRPWFGNGIWFKTGADGISMLLLLLTNIVCPLILIVASNKSNEDKPSLFGLIVGMQGALNGVFLAMDGMMFYIFWELALIPIYFICLLWGGADRIRITLKFFIYTLTGSLLMLVGLIYLYLQTPGAHTFALQAFYNLNLSATEQSFIFWALFLAFAVKIPIFPLHTWQPDTYTDAPTQGTMLLSGIMLKMGIYGLIRWMIPIVPAGMEQWGGLAIALCVTGIVYASCMAIVQKDYKRLIAYSSVAHVGLIAAGVLVLNPEGLQGALFQMLSHGVNVIGLFAIVDIIQRRMKTRNLDELGGLANNSPLFTVLFMIIVLGAVALPLTNGFVGEFLLLNGVFQFNAVLGAVAGLTIILGAVYMFRSYQKIMLGNANGNHAEFTGLLLNEKIILISVAALVIITGVYPKPILNVAQPVLEEILIHAKAHI